jgi:uncharacterized protein YjbI with pentapeptide repeats
LTSLLTGEELLDLYGRGHRDFRGANLEGARLLQANLRGADLTGARLEGAQLRQADLAGAQLSRALLRGVRLEEANLEGASLDEADLRGTRLDGTNLRGVFGRAARLAEASLERVNLRQAQLVEADLRGASLVHADLAQADLTRARLDGALLAEATLTGATLVEAHFAGASVRGLVLGPWKNEHDDWDPEKLPALSLWEAALHVPAAPPRAELVLRLHTPMEGLDRSLLDAVAVALRQAVPETDCLCARAPEPAEPVVRFLSSRVEALHLLAKLFVERPWETGAEHPLLPALRERIGDPQDALSYLTDRLDRLELWEPRQSELVQGRQWKGAPRQDRLFAYLLGQLLTPEQLRALGPLVKRPLPGPSASTRRLALAVARGLEAQDQHGALIAQLRQEHPERGPELAFLAELVRV